MIKNSIKELVDIDSPSGYTDNIIDYLIKHLKGMNYILSKTHKGALIVSTSDKPRYAVSGHIDTLGGMVKEIKGDGSLILTQIGGWPVNSFEGEYVSVMTSDGNRIRGTFLLQNPAAHVNRDVQSAKRDMSIMHVRLDAHTSSQKETLSLGISVGDFVFFDPRFEFTDTEYIKSRFMDDKACAGIMYDILINEYDSIKDVPISFFFSNYEEVGHGASAGFPDSIEELLVADMGVVGNGTEGNERYVSICAKDSSGPYDYKFRRELENLAIKNKLPYKTDVFPYYGSAEAGEPGAG